jgi:hypothetical protein
MACGQGAVSAGVDFELDDMFHFPMSGATTSFSSTARARARACASVAAFPSAAFSCSTCTSTHLHLHLHLRLLRRLLSDGPARARPIGFLRADVHRPNIGAPTHGGFLIRRGAGRSRAGATIPVFRVHASISQVSRLLGYVALSARSRRMTSRLRSIVNSSARLPIDAIFRVVSHARCVALDVLVHLSGIVGLIRSAG